MEDLMPTLSLRPLGSLRVLFVALSLAVATIVSPSGMAMAQQPQVDIVDTAVGAGSFTTLATALQAAGLVDTLKGEGPFTVFAPTDEAFAKLPAGTLEALLADPAKLQAVLTYHVVPGRVTAADVATLSSATTVQGDSITIDTSMGVRVNDAQVTQADIMTSNGVIHVIDTVLLPPGL
jgi:uncharacterized surface protein with fasciclin (FAS1) repeats